MRPLRFVNRLWATHCTTTVIVAVVVQLFLLSCQEEEKRSCTDNDLKSIPADSLAVMTTYNVVTEITDSGRLAYRVTADEWHIYDKRKPPYWAMEKGVFVEKLDKNNNVEATIKCDTAYYFSNMKLWKLMGDVDIRNPKNEKIFTQLLYWDQNKELIYSDAHVKIEQEDQVTEGTGFSSNQDLTVWEIKETKGIYAIKEEE